MRRIDIDSEGLLKLAEMAKLFDWKERQVLEWFHHFCGLLALYGPMASYRKPSSNRDSALGRICWTLGQLVNKHVDEDGSIAPEDNAKLNELVLRVIRFYGLEAALKAYMPKVQEGTDPLFVTEAWPDWWNWASTEFFGMKLDPIV